MRGWEDIVTPRLWRAVLAIAILAASLIASPNTATAATDAARFQAILQQVSAVADPYAAARALGASDQALLARGLRAVTVTVTVTPTSPQSQRAQGSSGGKLAAPLAGFCPDAYGLTYTMTNIFGMVLWKYNLDVTWCWDGTNVTSHSFNRYPSEVALFWQFVSHIGLTETGGDGQSYYQVWTQGFFQLCFPYCGVQSVYPWIRITVYGAGGASGTMGS